MKPLTLAQEVLIFPISIVSRFLNVCAGGSPYQTLSARSYVEAVIDEKQNHWDTYRRLINGLFFWQSNHCERAWLRQVERAMRTLKDHRAITGEGW